MSGIFNFFNKPAPLPTLSTSQVLNDTASQIGSVPGLTALTSSVNQATNNQFRDAIGQVLPGYQNALSTSMNNTNSFLNGELPADVISQITRSDAFKSLAGGYGSSSGMGNSLTSRDLGLNSLNLIQTGQQDLGQDLSFANMLTPGRLSPSQFLMGPGQVGAMDAQNNIVNYKNSTSQSPFDQFLGSLPSLALQGGISYATGGVGGAAGIFSKLFGSNDSSSPNPFNSFNPFSSGGGGSTPGFNPNSSIFNPSNNYSPSVFGN